jgi:hypothetical protein
MPVIPVYKVVDKKRILDWKQGAEEEERNLGSTDLRKPHLKSA